MRESIELAQRHKNRADDTGQLARSVLAEQSDWISVKDQLPEYGLIVIVAGGLAAFHGDHWVTHTSSDTGRTISWPVTHWMPLQYPPQ